MLLITHEQDIAKYAQRNIVVRDGLIQKDYTVEDRYNAVEDLANFKTQTVEEP